MVDPENLSDSPDSPDKLSVMKESAANRKLQIEGNDTSEKSVLCCPEFDIENPFGYAMDNLKAEQSKAERPFSLQQMTPKQQEAEKKNLKWILRNYDLAFQHRYGHFVCYSTFFVFVFFLIFLYKSLLNLKRNLFVLFMNDIIL